MSAKRKQPVNAQVANAKTPGEVTSANAKVVCSTRENMTRVLVRLYKFFYLFLYSFKMALLNGLFLYNHLK